MDENKQWRRFHNGELHRLYCSSNIVKVPKSRRLRWADYVSRLEEGRSAFKILIGKPTELHNLYRSPNIGRVIKSRRLRWAGHVVRMEEGRSAFKILTGKPTGKRPLGRPGRR